MSNNWIDKTIDDLKSDQKESHAKIENLTKEFYLMLKAHMDAEDVRWEHVQRNLEEIRLEQLKLNLKVSNHASIFNKVWLILMPVIIAALTTYIVI